MYSIGWQNAKDAVWSGHGLISSTVLSYDLFRGNEKHCNTLLSG